MNSQCGYVFSRQRQRLRLSWLDFEVFYGYVKGKTDYEVSADRLRVSRQETSTRFHQLINQPLTPIELIRLFPPKCLSPRSKPWTLGYDGKWLGRTVVLVIERDVTHRENLWWSDHPGETMVAVATDLTALAATLTPNHFPVGAVTDGKPGIGTVIKSTFLLSTYQRCLVHVIRDLKTYLPKYSPVLSTQVLRSIALSLNGINTKEDVKVYLERLTAWHRRFGYLLKERTIPDQPSRIHRQWWYTHSSIRRAWKLMTKHPETLFHYLINPSVPKTNNSLEGVNRHLHRRPGMSRQYQLNLMIWKLIFSRTKTVGDRRKLWDYLNHRQ